MSYNMTELKEAANPFDLVKYANTHSNNSFVGFGIFAIFFVFLFLFKKYGMAQAITGSSFLCFILSVYLSFAQLLNFYIPLVFLILAAFGGLYLYVNKNP